MSAWVSVCAFDEYSEMVYIGNMLTLIKLVCLRIITSRMYVCVCIYICMYGRVTV